MQQQVKCGCTEPCGGTPGSYLQAGVLGLQLLELGMQLLLLRLQLCQISLCLLKLRGSPCLQGKSLLFRLRSLACSSNMCR